jgi:MoxR-like ATPase
MQPAPAGDAVAQLTAQTRERLERVIVGQREMIDQCLAAILAGGHALLEGVPGVAKTLLVRTLSQLLDLGFQRVQCTSDLMPADLIGTNVLNSQTATFQLHKGPIFAEMVLVDEINRMPPRTQAALLEAMEERQVTIDGKRYPLGSFFTVFATQNPIDFEGTYPLPEAQLDRFLLKIMVPYPDLADEVNILARYHGGAAGGGMPEAASLPKESLQAARQQVASVTVNQDLLGYAARIARATRENSQVALGASPRAALNLLFVSKAYAAMDGRDYLIPDDVKRASLPVFRHRLILKPEAQLDAITADVLLTEIVKTVAVPR